MGANAQTTVPTFTAGQVLTAEQQRQSAATGVPVFATTVERDAAFGGTGEKTLAEGQLCYLESTNVVQYYDGAAWATVGPSSAGGLVFITGATFTTATSVSLPDSTFTSTYRNYRVMLDITAVTSDADFTMRLRASGSDDTTAVYQSAQLGFDTGNTASNATNVNASSWTVGEQDAAVVRYAFVADVIRPQVAVNTLMLAQYNFVNKAASANIYRTGGFFFNNATQFDSLSFISSVASSITGVYRVYGYADS
ncbi:MAG: hypothetical protein ACO3CG_08680 [Ilumatobacteraceae bacterium]